MLKVYEWKDNTRKHEAMMVKKGSVKPRQLKHSPKLFWPKVLLLHIFR